MRIFTKLSLSVLAFAALSGVASAVPLTVVNVSAPAINCVFNPACTVTVTDTVGNFPPATGYTGTPRLQSRTFVGVAGAPGKGLTAYVYRVDFTSAVAASDINCATSMRLKFGPVATLPYSGPAQVYVVTTGGLGSIGLASADKTGAAITFTFTSAVCPQNGTAPGQTSFFFGLASKTPPVPDNAKVALTFGGGVVNVPVRVPSGVR